MPLLPRSGASSRPGPGWRPHAGCRYGPAMRWARRWLLGVTGGEAAFPLAILFLLYFFDEFDTGAFNVLAPNIKKSFGLTDREFALVVVVNLGIVLLFAVPVGHWGDRLKRVLLVVIGAIIAGVFSFLTGVVTTMALLVVVRIGNGVGRLANDPIHTSLLSDYYRPYDRPRVFSVHRNSVQLGQILGSALAGLLAYLVGWRVVFMLLLVPIIVTALFATRLKEPVRGATDEAPTELQKEAAALPPLPFRAAARMLLAVKTLRRGVWGAGGGGGGGVAPGGGRSPSPGPGGGVGGGPPRPGAGRGGG